MKPVILLFIALLLSAPAYSANQFAGTGDYSFETWTGGTDNALDGVDTTNLTDGYVARIFSGGAVYFYVLDIDGTGTTGTQDVPDPVEPVVGPGQWDLYGGSGASSSSARSWIVSPHTSFSNNLSSSEVYRIDLAAGETFSLYRLQCDLFGGGTEADFSVQVYDFTTSTQLGIVTGGGISTGSPVATSGAGDIILIRITNTSGNYISASYSVEFIIE